MGKKINAVLGLSIIVAFLAHLGYELFAYITFYYNPLVTKVIAYIALGLLVLHILTSIFIVSTSHDKGKGIKYPKLNIRTILQRTSAGVMFLFIILHMNTFKALSSTASDNKPLFYLILASEVIFFSAVFIHIAVSFTNAFISLGLLSSGKKRQVIDIVVWVLCVVLFAAASIIIIRTQLAMFTGGAA